MKRKIGMFLFGIALMVAIVMAIELSTTIQLNKANFVFWNATCQDRGYEGTEVGIADCIAEESEDHANDERADVDKQHIIDLSVMMVNSHWFYESAGYCLDYIKDHGVKYYCQEGEDQVDYGICLWVENGGHDCYYCEGKHSGCMDKCINSVWTPYE